MTALDTPSGGAIPPIVLLVDDDRDSLDMYSTYFEREGLWVASATSRHSAMDAVSELKPDVIVTDIALGGRADGVSLVGSVRHDPLLEDIPIIVLTGREPETLPQEMVRDANLVLIKPVLPDALLTRIRELLAEGTALRARSAAARERTAALVQKSAGLLQRAARIKDSIQSPARRCPSCGARLEWLERNTIAGIECDYYRWCQNGCGLYCYQLNAAPGRNWVKLV